MREMKDSGIEWIGKIPKDWYLLRIQYCLTEINVPNSPIKSNQILSLIKDRGVILYKDKGNQGNKAKANYADYKLAYPNTLIINSMNILIGSVGISKYFGCVSPVYYVMKANNSFDIRFINYIFNTRGFQKELRKYANGILEIRLRVSASDIFKRLIPVPTKLKQQAIADFLDSKCADIDSLTEDIQKQIETLKEYKKSVITQAVTKGLDPNVEMKDSGIKWIGKIPLDVTVSRIKFNAEIVLGKMIQPTKERSNETYENYMCAANLKWNGIDSSIQKKMWFSKDEKELYLLKSGDILVTEGGSIGVSTVYNNELYPCYFQNSVMRLRTYKKDDISVFLYYWMYFITHCGYVESVCNKATILHYPKVKLANTPILVFQNEKKKEIVDFLDSKCADIDAAIEDKQKQMDVLKEYKKSLIYEYVTGKKEVPCCE